MQLKDLHYIPGAIKQTYLVFAALWLSPPLSPLFPAPLLDTTIFNSVKGTIWDGLAPLYFIHCAVQTLSQAQ